MKYAIAIVALLVLVGCAHKAPHREGVFRFVGVQNGWCHEDKDRSHWDAQTGEFVVICKDEPPPERKK